MTRLIDYMNVIGEQFELLTGGYWKVTSSMDREQGTDAVTLRCEMDDEILVVSGEHPGPFSTENAAGVAREIVSLFDRRARPHATTWTDLPAQRLDDLEIRRVVGARRPT